MKQVVLLLPDAALFVVLCRMAAVGLWRERTALFIFLCVWFLFCLSTIVIDKAAPHTGGQYAFIYSLLQFSAITALIPAAWIAGSNAAPHSQLASTVAAFAGAGIFVFLLHRAPLSFVFLAGYGAAFVVLSFGAADPDRVLLRAIGTYLIVFVAGVFLARKFGHGPAAYEWVAFACAAIWIFLALKITPTHDAIVSPAALALTPRARLFFGIARAARG